MNPRKVSGSLSYRVAIRRYLLSLPKQFSTLCRSLPISFGYSMKFFRLALGGMTGNAPASWVGHQVGVRDSPDASVVKGDIGRHAVRNKGIFVPDDLPGVLCPPVDCFENRHGFGRMK